MNIIKSILQQMPGISQSQKRFLVILFATVLFLYCQVNFTNLSLYSSLIINRTWYHQRSSAL